MKKKRRSDLKRNGMIGEKIRSMGFLRRMKMKKGWLENKED